MLIILFESFLFVNCYVQILIFEGLPWWEYSRSG